MIHFGPDICSNPAAATQREWLETNGLGGFASSTITGMNTRRYHGLLTAALQPPVGRFVLLSKLEETLVVDGQRFELSTNQYPGAMHPQGYQHLHQFRLEPFPISTYVVQGIEIDKAVFMIHGENSTVVHYTCRITPEFSNSVQSWALEVRPLLAFRDYHSTTHENGALNAHVDVQPGYATVTPYAGLPTLHCAHNATDLEITGHWYRNFLYAREQERGLDFQEDLFQPFVLRFALHQGASAALIVSTETHDIRQVTAYRQAECQRRQAVMAAAPGTDPLLRQLVAAADHYIVARGAQKTVIAGYHWFSDWGRDTMIALPGLTLSTGRLDIAKSIVLAFAQVADRGMLPNRFPDAGETPEYNTVDATLWFFEAIRALRACLKDDAWIRAHLYAVMVDMMAWHVRGTRYGIHMEDDGLLSAGAPGVQLTWMDAKVGEWVVTPRHGKAVEIQALWYNALRIMEHLAEEFGDTAGQQRYGDIAAGTRESFHKLFWHEAAGCLYDVIDGSRRDGSIRPNQIFAVSLPYSMLSLDRSQRVVDVVTRDLLTPYGLRSLAPTDPQYRGRYAGGPAERDGGYHQGTVWTWLLGPFITAYLKVYGGTARGRQQAAAYLAGLHTHLEDAGLGHLSEIFDGDAPHHPRGCIAQAWSVAEILRAMVSLQQPEPGCGAST